MEAAANEQKLVFSVTMDERGTHFDFSKDPTIPEVLLIKALVDKHLNFVFDEFIKQSAKPASGLALPKELRR